MTKKLLALMLALAMMFSLAACDSGTESSGDAPEAGAEGGAVVANPDYPNDDVLNVIVGWGAGGTTDLLARKVGSLMSLKLGCNANVINVTGASGSIGATQVQTESRNGDTIWGGMVSAVGTWKVMGYNDMDWTDWYIFPYVQAPMALCVAKDSPFDTYQEFAEYAKEHPGELKAGNPGLGSVGHLSAVALCDAMGVEANHVPYAGGRAASIAVMGGELDFVFISYGDLYDLVISGDLKPLGISSAKDKVVVKSDETEVTIPSLRTDYAKVGQTTDLLGMWGMALPRSTPAEDLAAFTEAWIAAVSSDEFTGYCDELGIQAVCYYGEEADKMMAESMSTYVWLLDKLELTEDSPDKYGIPTADDYSWDDVDLTGVNPWPVVE